MSTGRRSRGRRMSYTLEMSTHFNSIDTSSDLLFFTGNINSKDIFLRLLLSGLITNESFSSLYNKSELIGWKQVFIDLRDYLKLDEKSKPKRMILNRLIHECSTRRDYFETRATELQEEMEKQLLAVIKPEQKWFHLFQTIADVYSEVNKWRQLQCDRRLFYKEYDRRCPLPALQLLMTTQFLNLHPMYQQNIEAMKKLLDHCLITVVQPSGTDCFAVTKYEKVGPAFLAKIKIRIICLFDPNQIRDYIELSDVAVTLYPKNRELDPHGDVQAALKWKTRTIRCDGNQEQTFLYVELDENDAIQLTKLRSNRKLLYNNDLCQLGFRMTFKFLGINFEVPVTFYSQFFGLCSHAKFSSKFLAKVFLEEVKEIYPKIDRSTHIKMLEEHICRFHTRISGVDAKSNTVDFIHQKLSEVYEPFGVDLSMSFTIDIYEDLLVKLFSQIKFMGSHPFLSLMYSDSLFLGICSDAVDKLLNNNASIRPQLIMRFALWTEQENPDNSNIIFAVHNGKLCKSRVTHNYLICDMSTCICAAAQNQGNQIQVLDDKKVSPFSDFRHYYDPDLNRENLIHTMNETRYFPISSILHNTIQHNLTPYPISTNQENILHTFNLVERLQGDKELIATAIHFLQEQLTNWCAMRNV